MPPENQQGPEKKPNKKDTLLDHGHKTVDEQYRIRDNILVDFKETEDWFSAEEKRLRAMSPVPHAMIDSLEKSKKKVQELKTEFEKIDLIDMIRNPHDDDSIYTAFGMQRKAEAALNIFDRATKSLAKIKAQFGEEQDNVHYKNILGQEEVLAGRDEEFMVEGNPSANEIVYQALSDLKTYKQERGEVMPTLELELDPFDQNQVDEVRENFENEISTQRQLLEFEDNRPSDGSLDKQYKKDVLKEKYLGILGEYEARYRAMSGFEMVFDGYQKTDDLFYELVTVYDKYLEEKESLKNANVKIEKEPKQ